MVLKIDASALGVTANEFKNLAQTTLPKESEEAAKISGFEVRKEARKLVAVDTGALRLSIQSDADSRPSGTLVEIGPTQAYGKDIEYGRPAGTYVSPQRLERWARKRGLNPYAVARSIAKKGTRAQPFMAPAFNAVVGKIESIFGAALASAIKRSLKIT